MSIHLACCRAGRASSLSKSLHSFYAGPVEIGNRYGHRAGDFVQGALGGHVTAETLIERHSLFPYFASQVTSSVALRWRAALAQGHPDSWRRYLTPIKNGIRATHELKYCPNCRKEDLERYGLSHWHVAHQLPSIRFCFRHGLLLHDLCRSCRTPLSSKQKSILPGEECPHCGSQRTGSSLSRKSSKGYKSFATLTLKTLQLAAHEAAPQVRHRLLQHFIKSSGTSPAGLIDRFLAWWSVQTVAELEAQLQSPISAPALLQLMRDGYAKVNTPLMLAAIAFAWAHTSDADRCHLLEPRKVEDECLANRDTGGSADEAFNQLIAVAAQLHLPSRAAELLALGDRSATIDLIGRTNMHLLMEEVPDRIRLELTKRITRYQSLSRPKLNTCSEPTSRSAKWQLYPALQYH